MRKTMATVVMALFVLPASSSDCKTGYSTTIEIQDPDGHAVTGANITLSLRCGNSGTVSAVTDGSGEASFPYSLDDLGEIKITLGGFGASVIDKSSCSGPDKAKHCLIKFGT